jgi:hypothetical protein
MSETKTPHRSRLSLVPVTLSEEDKREQAREEAYMRLFEAIRGERPKPKRGNLRAV